MSVDRLKSVRSEIDMMLKTRTNITAVAVLSMLQNTIDAVLSILPETKLEEEPVTKSKLKRPKEEE